MVCLCSALIWPSWGTVLCLCVVMFCPIPVMWLRRPTMITYGVNNIRDLFGHKVKLSMSKTAPIVRLDKPRVK